MEDKKHLYIMISRTHTGIGKAIRRFSRYTYNHVSLTLDPTFRRWVSFARYIHNAPLYGGFIVEPVERYLADGNGDDVLVRIFKVEISDEDYSRLTELFSKAGNLNSGYVYNIFDIVAASVKLRAPVNGAYTCLGFAREVLRKDYMNIKALDEDLTPYMIYEGGLSGLAADSGDRTDRYFSKLNLLQGTKCTMRQLATLTSRAVRHSSADAYTYRVH
ncbi:MAG: hypothetical protein IJC86_05555 [Clostridia bacterium]|nr:hypothetical protein [Clostridia bacterium]